MYEKNPIFADAEARMRAEFAKKRADGTLSKAHDESHVMAVANYGGATARALANGMNKDYFSERWGLVAAVAGLLHDIRREARETEPHGKAGALYLDGIRNAHPYNTLSSREIAAIRGSVLHHEKGFGEIAELFGDPLSASEEMLLNSVVAHGLLTGDKALEASGYRVLERRSVFVGKERMTDGDLKGIFKYPEQSHLAVLGETLIRLYGRNPIDQYPAWLKPFAEEWHAIQYLFLKGLLEMEGLPEEKAADFMFKRGFVKFDGAMVDKINNQRHLGGKHFKREQYPVLAQRIEELNDLGQGDLLDLATSTDRVVGEFSQGESPEAVIAGYDPGNGLRFYRQFMEGIRDYRAGAVGFVRNFEGKIESAVRDIMRGRV